jgi:tRNA A-37 threonylcarbamoyl transferase component Bud32/membrane-associated phospholipid phosphatase
VTTNAPDAVRDAERTDAREVRDDPVEAAEKTDQKPTLDPVGEEREIGGIRLGDRRRRPSGEGPALRHELRTSGRIWLGLFIVAVALWVVAYAVRSSQPPVERLDDDLLDLIARARTPTLTAVARGFAVLGSVWCVLILRWGTIALLVAFRRWRQLVTFVVCVAALRTVVAVMAPVFGRPRPPGIRILGTWQGYSHPSRPVAVLAVTLVGMAFALVPAGTWRHQALRVTAVLVGLLVLSRLYLAVDHPTDALVGVVLGVAFAVVAFRVYCPDRIFPVSYRRRRAAHLVIEGERERAIQTAVRDQVGLEVAGIEPFGNEASGGSTPLRISVKTDDGFVDLFGKLYADVHLRSDRWYKLGRTILYGALEDEVAFNSVRQLVEYEDYMLRLMQDAGLPTPTPYGFVEIAPEREYLLLMELFERSKEADAATIDDAVIDSGLRLVQRMWGEGIAHRDVKPGNVLVQGGEVRLIDVAFAQVRPSPWRQAVDLANMMLVLALGSTAERVYERAARIFDPQEIGEAFAATRAVTMPSQLRAALKDDGRDLIARFVELAPTRPRISIQRWSVRRVLLTARTGTMILVGVVALLATLANPAAP